MWTALLCLRYQLSVYSCELLTHTCHGHYIDVITNVMASQITSPTFVHSNVYSGTDQIKHQRSALLTLMRGIHRWPVNSPHKGPVTRKVFPFDDVIMVWTAFKPPLCPNPSIWYVDLWYHQYINSFRSSDAIWRHRYESTWLRVMACYLNKC